MIAITTLDDTRTQTFVSLSSQGYGRRDVVLADVGVRVKGQRAGYISRRHQHDAWLDHRHGAALGLLILRAQRRDERHERRCNAGSTCATCATAFPG